MKSQKGISYLNSFVVRAEEYFNTVDTEEMQKTPKFFDSEKEYRFCKAVVDNPLLNSSEYKKPIINMSSKTAGPIRKILVEKGYIVELKLDSKKGRGFVLEATDKGKEAVEGYERQSTP